MLCGPELLVVAAVAGERTCGPKAGGGSPGGGRGRGSAEFGSSLLVPADEGAQVRGGKVFLEVQSTFFSPRLRGREVEARSRRSQSSSGRSKLAGRSLTGPRAAGTLAAGDCDSSFWSAAKTQQSALRPPAPCSLVEFGVLTGSTDRTRWHKCVSRDPPHWMAGQRRRGSVR